MLGKINFQPKAGQPKAENKFLVLENSIAGAAIIIAVFSVLTKLLGLWRDRLLAANFGAGEILDAYLVAFRLPDFVFNTLILGAFSSAFIPVFLNAWQKDKNKAWQITNSILNILFLIIFILSVFIVIFAPALMTIIAPGFSQGARDLAISFTRIITLSILFFTVSNVISSLLNSFHKFLVYSLAPLMYNLGIIFGILFLTKTGLGIFGLAWGVALGSFLHLAVQIPSLLKTGFVWQPLLSFSSGVKEIFFLMAPRFFGLVVNQLNVLITTAIASLIGVGAIAIYNLSFNLSSFAVGLVGVPLAVSVFPYLSSCYASGDHQVFAEKLSKTMKQIFYFMLPLTVIFFLFRNEIVKIILEAGLFTKKDSLLTAQALGFFSLSIFAQSLIPLLARAFYAQHNTKTPVFIAVISLVLNIVGCIILGKIWGVKGLALSFTFSNLVNFFLLYFFLEKQNFKYAQKEIIYPVFKFLIFSFLTGALIIFLKFLFAPLFDLTKSINVFFETMFIILISLLFYYLLSLAFKLEEAKKIKDIFRFFYV